MADSSAWGEFLALTAVAALGGTLAWTVSDRWAGYRTVRRHLTLMLVVLFVFATVVDLIADASGQNPALTLIEETGERFTLSMIGGYLAGLVFTLSNIRRGPGQATEPTNPAEIGRMIPPLVGDSDGRINMRVVIRQVFLLPL